MNFHLPKGTFDILPGQKQPWQNSSKWNYLEETIRHIVRLYNLHQVRTPIFERTELFTRNVGETSDIVSKEMYTFEDKAGRSMTLRPEGTAPVLRAYVDKHLYNSEFHKLFYLGPYFRYDRPQAGRFRQFHQLGVEYIGEESALADVELLSFAYTLFQTLGLRDTHLHINSVGNASSRAPYQKALQEHLRPHFHDLSEESQTRFETNPLRILDSKAAEDKKLLHDAPSIHDFLDSESKEHFESVCALLDEAHIDYIVDPSIVRGLDYYSKTVFEMSCGILGAQNVLCAGGRYDGFLKQFKGPDLPGLGFAAGLERILVTMEGQDCFFPKPTAPFVFVITLGDTAHRRGYAITEKLRKRAIPAEIRPSSSKKIAKTLQTAADIGVRYAIILGENELLSDTIPVKNLETRKEESVSMHALPETLQTLWRQHENT